MEPRKKSEALRRPSRKAWLATLLSICAALVLAACAEDGAPGADGAPGSDGAAGEDAPHVLLVTSPEPAGEECEGGGHRIASGADLNRDGVLSEDETTSVTFVCHGTDGVAGASSLVRLSRVPAGDACDAGGVRVELGRDVNLNGILDDDEVDHDATQHLCDLVPAPCSLQRELLIAGDYSDSAGNEHWLRATTTAATYTFVPGGALTPQSPPLLFSIERVCSDMDRLVLRADDGSVAHLDYLAGEGELRVCRRGAPDIQGAIDADFSDLNDLVSGCAGGSLTVLTLGGE